MCASIHVVPKVEHFASQLLFLDHTLKTDLAELRAGSTQQETGRARGHSAVAMTIRPVLPLPFASFSFMAQNALRALQ